MQVVDAVQQSLQLPNEAAIFKTLSANDRGGDISLGEVAGAFRRVRQSQGAAEGNDNADARRNEKGCIGRIIGKESAARQQEQSNAMKG
jgi:hypothetical protein